MAEEMFGWKVIRPEEYEALRKDAERYRWLRDFKNVRESERIVCTFTAEGMDDAIDAALVPQDSSPKGGE